MKSRNGGWLTRTPQSEKDIIIHTPSAGLDGLSQIRQVTNAHGAGEALAGGFGMGVRDCRHPSHAWVPAWVATGAKFVNSKSRGHNEIAHGDARLTLRYPGAAGSRLQGRVTDGRAPLANDSKIRMADPPPSNFPRRWRSETHPRPVFIGTAGSHQPVLGPHRFCEATLTTPSGSPGGTALGTNTTLPGGSQCGST